ncbi:MAG TPA: two-component regulator propeller domain-containing protein [Ohtaekwangia sp.]
MRGIITGVFLTGFFLLQESQAQHFLYSTRNYTAVDGLPQSQVTSMVEDANGYLWSGTQGGGLARFDGTEFKAYTTKDGLLSNDIIGLLLDRHQDIWILHTRGVSLFNGRTFKRYEDSKSTTPKRFRKIFQQGDSTFLITMDGRLSKIYQDSVYYWDKLLNDKRIMRYHKASDGTNIFLVEDGSFVVWSKTKSYTFSPGYEIGKMFFAFNFKSAVIIRTDKGLFEVDFNQRNVKAVPWNIDNFILKYDEENDFFWTSTGGSLVKQSFRNGTLKTDTILHDVEVNQIISDSEGNTWVASNGHGLYKYFIQDFNKCSSDNLHGVMAILKDRSGASWLGTLSRGLWKIKKGKVSSYLDSKESGRNSIHSIKQAADGTIWVATGFGFGKYNEATDSFTWMTREQGLPAPNILGFDFDSQGGVWVGTVNGLSYYNGVSFRNYSTADGLLSNAVWHLHYSKTHQTLFVANDFGLQTVKEGSIGVIKIPNLENTAIISVLPYQDSLLALGTAGAGVLVVNPINRKHRYITSAEGLASDFIYFAAQDENQDLWVGTEKGINRIKLDSAFEVIENLYYGYDNGLTGVETNANAFLITPEEKFFGLIDGLYEFNDLNEKPLKSFDLHLSDVQVFYGEYSLEEYADSVRGFFKVPHLPELPPDRNHITFHFNRVDKRYPRSVKFKYYLENFDKKWSLPTSMTSATYSNLPPGEYVFRVMSTNNKGSWDEAKVAYAFTIKAPFYQTSSFIVGLFILVAGIVTLILYLRVKQRVNKAVMLERIRVKEQETLRKEIARDFHDEMGNQLTRIINYVSLLRLSQNGNGNGNGSHDLYAKVEDSAKYLYNGTRDFIWSIDPVNDELSKLFIHIRDFGEKLFEEKGISFRAFNEVKEKMKLPYGFSREANLIFKEAMTNAFKYSEAKNVTFQLKRGEYDDFEMSLEDDGIGFSTDEIGKLNGLQNIQERADSIRAVLRITSVKNEGTKITINFKLTKTLKYGLAL